jgi:hypothetical protein
MSRVNLDLIEVPNPCTVPWESMQGDDRVRHCGQCRQNVYHLSKMSKEEAEELILQKEGKLCVQFYRRADGSVVTRSCAAVRLWRGLVSTVTLTCLGVLTFFGLTRVMQSAPANSTLGGFIGSSIKPPAHSPSTECRPEPPAPEVAPAPHEPAQPAPEQKP